MCVCVNLSMCVAGMCDAQVHFMQGRGKGDRKSTSWKSCTEIHVCSPSVLFFFSKRSASRNKCFLTCRENIKKK